MAKTGRYLNQQHVGASGYSNIEGKELPALKAINEDI